MSLPSAVPVLRYFFDPGSGVCLWTGNDAARAMFGDYPVRPDALPLTRDLREDMVALIERFDTSLDWAWPQCPSPWTREQEERFFADSADLLVRLRAELRGVCEISDESVHR